MGSRSKKIIDKFILREMALAKKQFLDSIVSLLGGALKEYTKLSIARSLNLPESSWQRETRNHLRVIRDKYIVKPTIGNRAVNTNQKFDRFDAFMEALLDSTAIHQKIEEARKHLIKIYPHYKVDIKSLNLLIVEVFHSMFVEFKEEFDGVLTTRQLGKVLAALKV